MQADLLLHGQDFRRDFVFLAVGLPIHFDDAEPRSSRRVKLEHRQRVKVRRHSVEAGAAGLDRALVFVCLADFKLEVAAFELGVEALDGFHVSAPKGKAG